MTQEKRLAQESTGYQGDEQAEALYSEPSEVKLTLQQKIIAVQNELKAPKGQYNSFGKYKYRSQEDILEALKPLLDKYGLLQTISDQILIIGDRFYIKSEVVVSDGATMIHTNAFAREPENKKGMDESQITGTASSYARKYALNGMWLIDDTKDADTDEHQEQVESTPNRQPPAKKPVKADDDGKEWINKDTKDWANAEAKIRAGKIKAVELRDFYKVSNDSMEYFKSLEPQDEYIDLPFN
jgi:hypothetical protein